MEIGIYTFGDLVADPHTGKTVSSQERMRQMLDLARLADEAGLDIIGVGEHHGLDFVNSATATTLSAMAAITKKIRLTSASTLLGTADPVRTFQEFATADLVSDGRVELIFGRGAFTESYPLFGFELSDYDALFEEKISLFGKLNAQQEVTWTGRFRPPLRQAPIAPRPAQQKLPVWIGAGSERSILRAARLGYPLALPVLGGSISGYGMSAKLYREARRSAGFAFEDSKVAVYAHLHIGETAPETREWFYPYYAAYLQPIFRRPYSSAAFDQALSRDGSFFGGSPDEVAEKILRLHEATGNQRFVGQIDVAGQPFSQVAKGIELLATKVAPIVHRALPREAQVQSIF